MRRFLRLFDDVTYVTFCVNACAPPSISILLIVQYYSFRTIHFSRLVENETWFSWRLWDRSIQIDRRARSVVSHVIVYQRSAGLLVARILNREFSFYLVSRARNSRISKILFSQTQSRIPRSLFTPNYRISCVPETLLFWLSFRTLVLTTNPLSKLSRTMYRP